MATIHSQISKLDQADAMASKAAQSPDIAARLGSVVLFAGMVDFCVIQAARLIEQIIIKGQLATGQQPTFSPSQDSYFYDHRISTSKILKGIRKFIPLRAFDGSLTAESKRITILTETMIADAFAFLDFRNPLLHQIGHPDRTFEDILSMVDQAIRTYEKFIDTHRQFMEAAAPYRFSTAELVRFYGRP